ncbi:SprT-like domain-containing protein [Cytobacillus solani]|uniref:SprT-like domain-containing protein n=1 Tax=Cytobacillus solani TaxID=1637975 RepID=UPI0006FBD211|nr:SprT-like domain-containing protein [Cytobacillus solani]
MSIEELTLHAEDFLRKHYDMELAIPIRKNSRLKRTLGCFITVKQQAECIEIAGYLMDYGATEVVLDTLYHELIHYALFTQGKPYQDGRVEFENELRKHGVSSTNTPVKVGKYIEYYCTKCGKEYETERQRVFKYPHLYRSRCCKAPINVVDFRIYDGTEAV